MQKHARPLPNGQPDTWPMVDRRGEDLPRLVEVAAGEQHPIDLGPVLGPFLDLVEIAAVRNQRLVGLFVGPIAHDSTAASAVCGVIHLPHQCIFALLRAAKSFAQD
jgi:hypothetical protein